MTEKKKHERLVKSVEQANSEYRVYPRNHDSEEERKKTWI